MKIALDPYMFRRLPLERVVGLLPKLGFRCLELSPREDFLPLLARAAAGPNEVRALRRSLRDEGVELVSAMVVYRWASPDERERAEALEYWREAMEIVVEAGCRVLNTEFAGSPADPRGSEAAFFRSIEALLPAIERHGLRIDIEPHPGDFVEDGDRAVDLVRKIGSPQVRYLYCAPHTFHMGEDVAAMLRYAAPMLAHVHVADSLNFRKGLRYIVNPIGAPVRVHQHLHIGEGEVDWDAFFGTLASIGFDGILTSCVFAWEDRAEESCRQMLGLIQGYLERFPCGTTRAGAGSGGE